LSVVSILFIWTFLIESGTGFVMLELCARQPKCGRAFFADALRGGCSTRAKLEIHTNPVIPGAPFLRRGKGTQGCDQREQ
jgi:hypothetical protein